MVLSDTVVALFYGSAGMRGLAALLGLLLTPPWRWCGVPLRRGEDEAGSPHTWVGSGPRLLWCLAGAEWLSSESFQSCQVTPCLFFFWLTKENRLLLGVFLSALWGVSGLPVLFLMILQIRKATGKPREPGTVFVPRCPGPLTLYLLPPVSLTFVLWAASGLFSRA